MEITNEELLVEDKTYYIINVTKGRIEQVFDHPASRIARIIKDKKVSIKSIYFDFNTNSYKIKLK